MAFKTTISASDAGACQKAAQVIWDYFLSFSTKLEDLPSCSWGIIFGGYELNLPLYASELYHQHLVEKLFISGQQGLCTRLLWTQSEAAIYRQCLQQNQVALQDIAYEDQATNTGENIVYTQQYFQNAASDQSFILISRPETLLRIGLSIKKQWPSFHGFFHCPSWDLWQDISPFVGILGRIRALVGEMTRIMHYPQLGFCIPHQFPQSVLLAYQELQELGFEKHAPVSPF